jgi:hypothetical protein
MLSFDNIKNSNIDKYPTFTNTNNICNYITTLIQISTDKNDNNISNSIIILYHYFLKNNIDENTIIKTFERSNNNLSLFKNLSWLLNEFDIIEISQLKEGDIIRTNLLFNYSQYYKVIKICKKTILLNE